MDSKQANQYRMGTELVAFLQKRAAELAPSAVAQQEAADVLAAYEPLRQAVGTAPLATQASTNQATTARRRLLKLLPAVQGPLQSIASKATDTRLLARATLTARQLRRFRPAELRDVAANLLADATTHAPELAAYGLGAPVLTQLAAAHTAFASTVGTTQSLIDERKGAGNTVADRLRAFLQQVYELDKPLEVFRLLDPALFRDYRQVRRVGTAGGGHPGSAPAPPPALPSGLNG